MLCGYCDKTDGCIYTSLPPMVKCILTDKFHFMNDECDVENQPSHSAVWVYDEKNDNYICSACGQHSIGLYNYCPDCGAKMGLKYESEK